MARAAIAVVLTVFVSASLLAACSGGRPGSGSASGSASGGRRLTIVAGENFWGSLVSQLAGRAGDVTSLLNDPNADPHTYEIRSADARAFAAADYVVLNGAGYDPWAERLLRANPSSRRKVLNVGNLLNKREGDNPHFWYSPAYVDQVIARMAVDLKALDPADSTYFDAERRTLDAALAPYRSRLAEIRTRFGGTPVASTETIFVYLGQDLGLKLISPPDFMRAVAEGNDPTPASVAEFQIQLTSKQARVLIYNKQASTAVTTNVRRLATRAGIPQVGVTEMVAPRGETFERWFEGQLAQLEIGLSA